MVGSNKLFDRTFRYERSATNMPGDEEVLPQKVVDGSWAQRKQMTHFPLTQKELLHARTITQARAQTVGSEQAFIWIASIPIRFR